jgi:hypothetical protein
VGWDCPKTSSGDTIFKPIREEKRRRGEEEKERRGREEGEE